MKKTDELKSLLDEYCVPGFKTLGRVRPDEKDPTAFALTLVRRQKKICSGCGKSYRSFYDRRQRRMRDLDCGERAVYLTFELRRVYPVNSWVVLRCRSGA